MFVGRESPAAGKLARSRSNFPGEPAVRRTGLHRHEGAIAGHGMKTGLPLRRQVPCRETEDDFIAPRPHAEVGRPAGKASGFPIYDEVFHHTGLPNSSFRARRRRRAITSKLNAAASEVPESVP